jgi:hypothetical protein
MITSLGPTAPGVQKWSTLLLAAFVLWTVDIRAAIPSSERATLVALYSQTAGAGWANADGWNGDPGTECAWFGVTCDNSNSTVIGISLSTNFLHGTLPSLTSLPNLQVFDVGNAGAAQTINVLSGSLPDLNGLPQLKRFVANNSLLSGPIPTLSGLANLQYFDVSHNQLTTMPDLSGLGNLQTFLVHFNEITGGLPSLGSLPQLNAFRADNNQLTGGIPSLSGLAQLTTFRVDSNQLTGNIPDLAGLNNLSTFAVPSNQLSGPIPSLSGLSNLSYFDVTANQLSGNLPDLSGLVKLQLFGAGGNHLTGGLPSLSGLGKLAAFYVWSNQLSGVVPAPPSQLPASSAGLCPNQFTAAIEPPSAIDVAWNTATGTTPWSRDCSTSSPWVTAISLSSDQNPSVQGRPITLRAAVYGVNPTGTMSFSYSQQSGPKTILCASAPVLQSVATCTTLQLPQGSSNIYATYSGDSANLTSTSGLPYIENLRPPVPFDANQFALTGTWYNPATSGQGLLLEVYVDKLGAGQGIVGGGWFTFDTAGHQQWYTMQGNLTSAHGSLYNVNIYQTAGGVFNAPPPVETRVVGSGTLSFYDCTHAALSYSFDDGRAGVIPYSRLSDAANCSTSVPVAQSTAPANYNDVLHAGAWYNPATSGQGVLVDISPSQSTLFAAWYTYAPAAEGVTGISSQRWFTLQANAYTPGNLNLTNVPIYVTSGGVFNTPGSVTRTQVGTANVSFSSCSDMQINYGFTVGEFSGISGRVQAQNLGIPQGCQ